MLQCYVLLIQWCVLLHFMDSMMRFDIFFMSKWTNTTKWLVLIIKGNRFPNHLVVRRFQWRHKAISISGKSRYSRTPRDYKILTSTNTIDPCLQTELLNPLLLMTNPKIDKLCVKGLWTSTSTANPANGNRD